MLRALLVPLLLGPVLAPLLAPAPTIGDVEEAARRLNEALARGGPDERREALDALVALGDADAAAALQAEYARVSEELRRARDDLVDRSIRLERHRAMLAAMELRASNDASVTEVVSRLRREVGDLEEEVGRLERRVDTRVGQAADLGGAVERLFAGLASGAARKATKALWEEAEEHPELGVRIGAVEVLGRVGGPGTALDLVELVADVHRERAKLAKELPELEAEVRAFEERFQREQDQTGGTHSRATEEQYDRLRARPAALRRERARLALLAEAAAEAGGRALAREEDRDLGRSLDKLARTLGKADGALRLSVLDLVRHADAEPVRARLRALLDEEEDPLVRAELASALAAQGDREAVPRLLALAESAPSWHVRSRAIAALDALRAKEAIPLLIDRLEDEDGRLAFEARAALRSLTGKRFGPRPDGWRRWWEAEGASFEVPAAPAQLEGGLDAREAANTTFFGVESSSRRVLFVLDVSGSMRFSMVPRSNPNDDPGRPPDLPRGGEDSRLEAAKRELVKALGGIPDGGLVNVVLYATDCSSWADEPVPLDTETRSELLAWVERLTANGGTNVFGALALAFDLAGAGGDDAWSEPAVDTIFFLSDGRASVGVTTATDEILAYVRERNRAAGITLHTIGLSGAQDARLLGRLAEENGGTYVAR